jgi:hypothetical protein
MRRFCFVIALLPTLLATAASAGSADLDREVKVISKLAVPVDADSSDTRRLCLCTDTVPLQPKVIGRLEYEESANTNLVVIAVSCVVRVYDETTRDLAYDFVCPSDAWTILPR